MAKFIALLRGINVGGNNIIKMESLRNTFETAGLKNVKTYIQSGNVIFDSSSKSIAALTKKIEKQLQTDYGKELKTIIRSVLEIEKIVKINPFEKYGMSKDIQRYVYFLYEEIPPAKKLPEVTADDAAEIIHRSAKEIFIISHPLKNGRYGYPKNFTDKKLGTFYTARNWNTVYKINNMINE